MFFNYSKQPRSEKSNNWFWNIFKLNCYKSTERERNRWEVWESTVATYLSTNRRLQYWWYLITLTDGSNSPADVILEVWRMIVDLLSSFSLDPTIYYGRAEKKTKQTSGI